MAYLDNNGVLYFWQKIKTYVTNAISGKVDAETGKGLSTNDYTTEEKTKLSNISAGAQVNVLEGIQKNGDTVTITNKIANISVPTKTSDLTNDSNFITLADVPDGAVASTTTPKMDGIANAGSETAFARGDHVHPSDSTKVDKVSGKGLSTNDYTTAEKEKLAGIEAGAQVNPTKVSAFTNDAGYLTQHQDISGKVDKVSGKGLSTNDYTTAEKNKLGGIESGAEENVIETISVNGSEQTVTDKTVDITVPTKVSDLTNDSGFVTAQQAAASAPVQSVNGKTGTVSLVASDVGAYVKPSGGIPASDLASGVIPDISGKADKISGYGLVSKRDITDGYELAIADGKATSIQVVGIANYSAAMQQAMTVLAGKADASSVYTKTEIDGKLTNAYIYKGSVATVSDLPSSGVENGWVYNVEASGMNYAWNGSEWDALGEIFTITAITNAEIDTICT